MHGLNHYIFLLNLVKHNLNKISYTSTSNDCGEIGYMKSRKLFVPRRPSRTNYEDDEDE